MHHPEVEQKRQAQFEKDKTAFEALSPGKQRLARTAGDVLYGSRWTLVKGTDALLRGVEFILNGALGIPAAAIAEGVRRLLPAQKNAEDKTEKNKPKGPAGKINRALRRLGETLEYRGAIGLFRATQWVLDPRRPSGAPLFGNEKLNKTVGLGIAGVAFFALSGALSAIAVTAKVWHVELARSMMTDQSPVLIKMAKQLLLQPLITVGLTSVKFFTLPAIAGARSTLKTSPLVQGLAYRYNERLRRPKTSFNAAAAPKSPLARWLSARMKKRPLEFIRAFFAHVAEKSSPEFYGARIDHYKKIREDRRKLRRAMRVQRFLRANAPPEEGSALDRAPRPRFAFGKRKRRRRTPPAPRRGLKP